MGCSRIIKVFNEKDGYVRVVLLRDKNNKLIKRNIHTFKLIRTKEELNNVHVELSNAGND